MRRGLAAALLLAACASTGGRPGPTTPAASAEEQEVARAYDDLLRADGELRAAHSQSAPPDCARIGQLRDNICALAARICQLADRQPPGSPATESCTDGKARCQAAVEASQARGCPTKKVLLAPSHSR